MLPNFRMYNRGDPGLTPGCIWRAPCKKYILPILDAEVADGTVLMYNFDTEDIHTDPQGEYFLAVVYPSGEAMDKAYARLATTTKENPAVGEVISSITVTEAHRDSLGKISDYQHK